MQRALVAAGAVVALTLGGCSLMFPHAEKAIEPRGATLEELGIALLADIERWVDALLFLWGLQGL